ncbi:MAG: type VI secretion system membrane subunit TssM, partial [Pseudomonadota bacterium]
MWKWIAGILVVLALLCWAAVVWFAFPLIGFGESRPFDSILVRVLMIAVVWITVGTIYLIRFLIRRRRAKALEEAITEPEITGDGEELSERMSDALSVLKNSSGSKAYLYELPWYVIIGPPGAGKTTALLNSGIKFPLAEKGGSVSGVGGTRYCDWWFSDEAVLIDTAGRYTTQDSDAEADKESWFSFLKLLKTNRARQPINGVIVAISLQEIMTDSAEQLEMHADTIRKRLMEIHDQLRVDFPVYVLFTKADLISGFMEYFGTFSASRRQKVWGHTFQTNSKKEATVERFIPAYDELVSRLSEEVTDRLQEEADGVNRIAIFGFPGQVAMLRDRLEGFMKGIFGHTRYKVNANLRGFYFSSGTQEGNPIDQVLGAMERNFQGMGVAGALSGKGKSYFLHDLLRKVIFAEAGWVSTDRRAVRRAAFLRYGAYTVLAVVTFGMVGLWGTSFWQNRQLVRTAQAAIVDYELLAQDELQTAEISSFDLQEVLPYLDTIRNMPLGYADRETETRTLTERFGLSQRDRLRSASEATYRQALERMFRSRLILRVEAELEKNIREGEVLSVYESLKVYKLLGVDTAPKSDDDFVVAWFRDDWTNVIYPGPQLRETRVALEDHLRAMLDLDAAQEPSFELNGSLVDQAERTLARMNVGDVAYSLIQSGAQFADGIEDFTIVNRAGRDADLVFETIDGQPIEDMIIPALYTYRGFHDFFLPRLSEIAEALLAEQWVMGVYAEEAQFEDQISKVGPPLLRRYTQDWIREWDTVLNNLKLRPMAADKPRYEALGAASAARTSPILLLSEQIGAETKLTSEFSEARISTDSATDVATNIADEFGNEALDRFVETQTGLKRIGLEAILDNTKGESRAGAAGREAAQRLPGNEIEQYYADWDDVLRGEPGSRVIDRLIETLSQMQNGLLVSVNAPDRAAALLPPLLGSLKQSATRMPSPLDRMIDEAISDFEGDAANTSISRLNDALAQNVTQRCEAIIANRFPFSGGSSRDVSIPEFSQLFAPNGVIDRFFLQELSQFADLSGSTWSWKTDGPLAGKLSNATLKQFERAASIRDAFFASGGGTPNIAMTFRARMHSQIDVATLDIDGQPVITNRGTNTPTNITWPGSGAGNVTL